MPLLADGANLRADLPGMDVRSVLILLREDRPLPGSSLAELHPARLRCRQSGLCALGDEGALLLRQGGVDVQHERIHVRAEFGDDEGHALYHQAGYEVNVAR